MLIFKSGQYPEPPDDGPFQISVGSYLFNGYDQSVMASAAQPGLVNIKSSKLLDALRNDAYGNAYIVDGKHYKYQVSFGLGRQIKIGILDDDIDTDKFPKQIKIMGSPRDVKLIDLAPYIPCEAVHMTVGQGGTFSEVPDEAALKKAYLMFTNKYSKTLVYTMDLPNLSIPAAPATSTPASSEASSAIDTTQYVVGRPLKGTVHIAFGYYSPTKNLPDCPDPVLLMCAMEGEVVVITVDDSWDGDKVMITSDTGDYTVALPRKEVGQQLWPKTLPGDICTLGVIPFDSILEGGFQSYSEEFDKYAKDASSASFIKYAEKFDVTPSFGGETDTEGYVLIPLLGDDFALARSILTAHGIPCQLRSGFVPSKDKVTETSVAFEDKTGARIIHIGKGVLGRGSVRYYREGIPSFVVSFGSNVICFGSQRSA